MLASQKEFRGGVDGLPLSSVWQRSSCDCTVQPLCRLYTMMLRRSFRSRKSKRELLLLCEDVVESLCQVPVAMAERCMPESGAEDVKEVLRSLRLANWCYRYDSGVYRADLDSNAASEDTECGGEFE